MKSLLKKIKYVLSTAVVVGALFFGAKSEVLAAEGDYLTFTAQEAGSTVSFDLSSSTEKAEYSLDGGATWTNYADSQLITLANIGDRVCFKGKNAEGRFYMTGLIAASGDVTSLTNELGGDVELYENCYSWMFGECTSLTSAPNLPSTKLAYNCYTSMFSGCTSLTSAPELPATKVEITSYCQMFRRCTSLKRAPELPATILAPNCYSSMFYGCTSLEYGPTELPAEDLACRVDLEFGDLIVHEEKGYAWGCYDSMFRDCTSLKRAPEIRAKILAPIGQNFEILSQPEEQWQGCFASMFENCTALESGPSVLPAEILEPKCYISMFANCTSLKEIPELKGKKLAKKCYQYMFRGCTSLETVPDMLDLELDYEKDGGRIEAEYACDQMFGRCTALKASPRITANTLALGSFKTMFDYCTALEKAAPIKAEVLAEDCFAFMFEGCSALKNVPEIETEKLANGCFWGMLAECTSLTSIPSFSYTDLIDYCFDSMFKDCSKLALSSEKHDDYDTEWRIDASGSVGADVFARMFKGCITDFGEEPEVNKTYYLKTYRYDITTECDGIGTVSADKTRAKDGETVTLTATPGAGYVFDKWVCDEDIVISEENTFVMPDKNVTIKAVFKQIESVADESIVVPYSFFNYTTVSESYSSTLSEENVVQVEASISGENVVQIKASISGETATINEITADTLKKAGNNENISIDVSKASSKVNAVILSKQTFDVLASAIKDNNNKINTLEIKFSNVILEIDKKAMNAIQSQVKDNKIKISVDTKNSVSKLNNAQQNALKNKIVLVVFSAVIESNGTKISNFNGGSISVTLALRPAEGTDPNYYHIEYVSDTGSIERYVTKVTKDGIEFVVPHFSDYAIVYDTTKANHTIAISPKTGSPRFGEEF